MITMLVFREIDWVALVCVIIAGGLLNYLTRDKGHP